MERGVSPAVGLGEGIGVSFYELEEQIGYISWLAFWNFEEIGRDSLLSIVVAGDDTEPRFIVSAGIAKLMKRSP